MSDLYDDDILAWSEAQAERLRRVAAGERVNDVDWEHVIEEIEAVGDAERGALLERLTTAVEHLLKLAHSPTAEPRAGWRVTVQRSRVGIARLLKRTPSLKRDLPGLLDEAKEDAAVLAADALEAHGEGKAEDLAAAMAETARAYTLEQVQDRGWWPPEPEPAVT